MSLRDLLRKLFYKRKSIFDPTKNYSQLPFQLVDTYSAKKILDIGAGAENLSHKAITLDKYAKADITADAQSLPIKSNSINLAICIAVLEHLKEPQLTINEIFRVLKKDGQVYIEVPFLQPFHASPNDYFRTTLSGLKHWCRNFYELKSGVCVGSGSAVSWLEIEYIRLLFGNIPLLGIVVELLFRLWSLPLKYIDKLIISKKDSHKTASALYFYGKKP